MDIPYEELPYPYAVTVKCVMGSHIKEESDYVNFWNWLNAKNYISFLDGAFIRERDKKGNLHLHGTIRSHRLLNYRSDMRLRGYHIYCRRIYDEIGWYKYKCKEKTPILNFE